MKKVHTTYHTERPTQQCFKIASEGATIPLVNSKSDATSLSFALRGPIHSPYLPGLTGLKDSKDQEGRATCQYKEVRPPDYNREFFRHIRQVRYQGSTEGGGYVQKKIRARWHSISDKPLRDSLKIDTPRPLNGEIANLRRAQIFHNNSNKILQAEGFRYHEAQS